MQPSSLLKDVSTPFYTRTITPQAAEPPTPEVGIAPPSRPVRPTARLASAKPVGKTPPIRKKAPQRPASAPQPDATPPAEQDEQLAQAPGADTNVPDAQPGGSDLSSAVNQSADGSAPSEAPNDIVPASETPGGAASDASAATPPQGGASDAPPAFLAGWPSDTRLRYRLGGNYRGELHGDAEVLWQREGTRYQAVIKLDVGILLSSRFTSQGDITEAGLRPKVYEEQIRKKRRGIRLAEDVRLDNGERVPRPVDIQDAASQFVELGHRFATGQAQLQPGGQINFWLARPGGVDEWTYDMVGEDTLHLPQLGPVSAVHLKPRPLAKPRGPIAAEIWFAPSLQYLPVKIRITSGPDTYVDLMVETIEQK